MCEGKWRVRAACALTVVAGVAAAAGRLGQHGRGVGIFRDGRGVAGIDLRLWIQFGYDN